MPISAEAIKSKLTTEMSEFWDSENARKSKQKQAIPEATTEKPQPQLEPKSVFPAEAKLNKYGFIYLNDNVLTAWLGHGKGKEAGITVNMQDDALLIRKVQQ